MNAVREVELILHGRWVIPVVPRHTLLEHHSIAVHEGKIVAIMPTPEIKLHYQSRHSYDGSSDRVLMPGLVNMHTHVPMTLLRCFTDAMPLAKWLNDYIWPIEAKFVSPDFVRVGTRIAILELLRSGTTCFNDQYFYPDVVAQEAARCGIRACIGIPVFSVPTMWSTDAADALEKGLKAYQQFKHVDKLRFALSPHAVYTVDDETFLQVRRLSLELGLRVHTHLHETREEIDGCLKKDRESPIAKLQRLDLFNSNLICAHMAQLSKEEIELAGKCGVHVAHCPESNMKLASGVCPIAALRHAGANVCIGTDGAASNDDLDMFGEIRTASLLEKLLPALALPSGSHMPGVYLDCFTFLEMATINGAKALAIDDRVGSLEVTKDADIISVKVNVQPVYHAPTALVYVGSNTVTDVWIAGEQILDDRSCAAIDEIELKKEACEWGAKIATHRRP